MVKLPPRTTALDQGTANRLEPISAVVVDRGFSSLAPLDGSGANRAGAPAGRLRELDLVSTLREIGQTVRGSRGLDTIRGWACSNPMAGKKTVAPAGWCQVPVGDEVSRQGQLACCPGSGPGGCQERPGQARWALARWPGRSG